MRATAYLVHGRSPDERVFGSGHSGCETERGTIRTRRKHAHRPTALRLHFGKSCLPSSATSDILRESSPQRRHVIFQVLTEGGRLASAGALAGTLGSLLLSRMLGRIAPGNRSPALWVWLAAPVALAVAVAIASILPARRALIVNPLEILRDEN